MSSKAITYPKGYLWLRTLVTNRYLGFTMDLEDDDNASLGVDCPMVTGNTGDDGDDFRTLRIMRTETIRHRRPSTLTAT